MEAWLAAHGLDGGSIFLIGVLWLGATLAVAGVALARGRRAAGEHTAALATRLESLLHAQERGERVLREELAQSRRELAGQTHHLREEVGGSLRAVGETVEKRIEVLRGAVDLRLGQIQQETQKRLEGMRVTVDEKLQGTLEQRLGAAFQQVSLGLGEMQTLAVGVGDLKKVLTNVRARGSFGETRLEALLEDALAPDQWQRQTATRPASSERVDAAVRLPGGDDGAGHPLWLPIDAKFPHDDYERLLDAHERGDVAAAEEAGRSLEARLRTEARAIRDKYVCPPYTTDF